MDSTPLKSSGITFNVDDVVPSTERQPSATYGDVISKIAKGRGKVEAYSRDTVELITSPYEEPFESERTHNDVVHGFVEAVNLAYDQHYPLVISPDMVWLMIAQGVSCHILQNAEAMRSKFVSHDGKVRLTVRRDKFVRGFEGNDWEGAIAEFGDQIRDHVGDRKYEAVVQEFSTTGIAEKASFEVTLLEAMQNYFEYCCVSGCGIPSITLEGTADDWTRIRGAVAKLLYLDLDWWTDHLLPVLDEFVDASRGKVNLDFWRNFYKLEEMSGGPYITGGILNFFPYLIDLAARRTGGAEMTRNRVLGVTNAGRWSGITTAEIPTGISIAPFVWEYYETKLNMEFLAGFVGVRQDSETLALRPEIGWAVVEKGLTQ